MELLVIDGASTDGTRGLIDEYRAKDVRVRLVDNPQGNTPSALNRGIDAARGEIIARVDAHAAVPPDYFTRCVAHLTASGADNVGGVMRTLPQDPGYFAGPIVAALSHPFGVGNSHFRIGSREPRWVDTVFGGCWRREVFARVGRFNPALLRSQDLEFSLRLKALGGRTLLVPDVSSDYYARSRMGPFWRHNVSNGKWAILPFLSSPVMPVAWRHLIPLLFVMALLLGIVLAPWTRAPLAAVALLYALVNAAASVHVSAREHRPRYLFLMPLAFFALHLSYGLGSLAGLVQVAAAWRPSRAEHIKPIAEHHIEACTKESACLPRS
jgi:glycosyltransferase involved in cell wall biosynthesis